MLHIRWPVGQILYGPGHCRGIEFVPQSEVAEITEHSPDSGSVERVDQIIHHTHVGQTVRGPDDPGTKVLRTSTSKIFILN